VVAAEFEGPGNVVAKIMGDLKAKSSAVTEAEIRARSSELMAEAVAQVKAGQ
jgi:hypothetical protein